MRLQITIQVGDSEPLVIELDGRALEPDAQVRAKVVFEADGEVKEPAPVEWRQFRRLGERQKWLLRTLLDATSALSTSEVRGRLPHLRLSGVYVGLESLERLGLAEHDGDLSTGSRAARWSLTAAGREKARHIKELEDGAAGGL